MEKLLTTAAVAALMAICLQDFKERAVYIWWFLVVGILLGGLHYQHVYYQQFITTCLINGSLVTLVVLILYAYARFGLKIPFKDSIGLGDLCFFGVFALAFPTATFLVLFSHSILFSFCIHLLTQKHQQQKTVPLAGFQALFISLVLVLDHTLDFVNLYTY